ncbi:unnamed protein product [Oikopleura dioica]|uniref:cyclin-dependent kinase n=1 Tax=Oikopleura dioica TaxID=34765 RepID=E4YU00_OIKDI|nr:unnamed protein product [Oikopleura dioica]
MEEIGGGAYGVVFRARDRQHDNRVVALKRLRVQASDEGMPLNTIREIAILRRLVGFEHPNVVSLLDVCCSRRNDHEISANGGVSLENCRHISRQLLSGLDFLHSQCIVHRDLKPQNVLITSQQHEMRLLPEEQQNFIRSELALIEKESSDASHTGYILQLAKEFDEFLALRFPDVKRYGLEGSETIMLWFDTILNEVDKDNHVTIGMTHRGRNNLLVCLLGLRADIMFGKMSEFGDFDVVNAPLTEQAVVAFEWGYSIDHPNNLCLWEAQFGDFWNQAEVSVDTLVTCGEQKWGLQSSLLMLLPHGYDGAGPEHSSSRVERLLQMTDSLENDNINFQIMWPSTAAQYFHILRRQMVRNYRKPGAIVMPKTLLRLPESRSTFAEMGPNTSFQTVIDDPSKNMKAKRVVVTAGKHYFTLVNERAKRGMQNDVAIVRLEQLVPFPAKEIQETLARYTNATSFVFSQEEPRNCGAWSFAKPRLDFISGRRFSYTGRPEMPTSATGTGVMHRRQLVDLLEDTFKL